MDPAAIDFAIRITVNIFLKSKFCLLQFAIIWGAERRVILSFFL